MRPVRYSIDRQALTPAFLDELWAFVSGFVVRSREVFEAALRGYEFISVWRDRYDHRLVGFSANRRIVLDSTHLAIYSGWAMLAPEVRGTHLIQREGLRCFLLTKLRHPGHRAYWVFGASTYKSYMLLPRNFARYFPHRDRPWEPEELAVRDRTMAAIADPHWDPTSGVIHRFGASRYLEGVKADVPHATDPDLVFYLAANPSQDQGDTLIAVVPLSMGNWGHLARRAMGRFRASRPRSDPP